MVPEPGTLEARRRPQEAGERLSDPAVRAVLVCDDGQLVGVVTRKTLVQRSSRRARSRATPLREIAEPPLFTLDASLDLDDAFRALEDTTSSACRSSRTAAWSASSRARSCNAGSPRTSRRARSQQQV
jgi:CBS domain-containing protein